jgi:Na+/H+ antiporter NhaD/arsenite permease-like protein
MSTELIALIIFVITYTGIIFTRLPKVNIDRPSAAFFGAVAMVIFGVLSFQEAVYAVDYNTIALLLGMMIIISTLQLDGFFELVASKTIRLAHTPFRLLAIITIVTGFASAFLVNDAVVLLFTPVIINICRSARINPLPYLIAEILASNAGSVMTITGNPQNMLIGINSGITYAHFMVKLLPISLISLVLIIAVVRWVYRLHFEKKQKLQFEQVPFQFNYQSMKYSVPIFVGVVAMFFLSKHVNISIPLIALAGAALILLFGRIKPSKVIMQVDWVLLLFFAALFIVVHGIEKLGLIQNFLAFGIIPANVQGLGLIHFSSLLLSQIVSNVPFTVLMLPVMKASGNELLWLALASASTLAGNATLIGAMANLIVIESAEKQGIRITFFEFLKTGLLVTLVSLLISMGVLYLYL